MSVKQNLLFFILAILILFPTWLMPDLFFSGDIWIHLTNYITDPRRTFFTAFGPNFFPISSAALFLYAKLFGVTLVYYQAANFLLYAVIVVLVLNICKHGNFGFEGKAWPLILTLLLCTPCMIFFNFITPDCGLFMFLQSILELGCLLCFFRFLQTRRWVYFYISLLLCLVQNYVMAKGIFLPAILLLSLIATAWLDKHRGRSLMIPILLLAAVQALFILVQLTAARTNVDRSYDHTGAQILGQIIADPAGFVSFYFKHLGFVLAAFFFVNQERLIFLVTAILLFAALNGWFVLLYRKQPQKMRMYLLLLIYFSVQSLLIPLTRNGMYIAHQHKIITFFPLFLLSVYVVGHLVTNLNKRKRLQIFVKFAGTALLVLYLVLNLREINRQKGSVALDSYHNQQAMRFAISNNIPYQPRNDRAVLRNDRDCLNRLTLSYDSTFDNRYIAKTTYIFWSK